MERRSYLRINRPLYCQERTGNGVRLKMRLSGLVSRHERAVNSGNGLIEEDVGGRKISGTTS